MACDVCGARVENTEPLRDCYQTDDIKAVCPECLRIADKELDRLNTWLYRVRRELLKRALRHRHDSIFSDKTNDL